MRFPSKLSERWYQASLRGGLWFSWRSLCLTALMALMALVNVACGDELEFSQLPAARSSILNGTLAQASDFPAVGAILISASLEIGERKTIASGSFCTGTLIEPDVVLTAAHCIDEEVFSRLIRRQFGDEAIVVELNFYFSLTLDVSNYRGLGVELELPPRTYVAAHLVSHEGFSLSAFENTALGLGENNDIGLIYLGEVVEDVEPSILMRPEDSDLLVVGTSVSIAGYGQSEYELEDSLGVKYWAATEINEVGYTEMQIGRRSPLPQKCRGDSGGPTSMYFEDGLYPAWRVVGITSHAYSRDDCSVGGVDTRVDRYWDWLASTMIAGCFNGLRIGCPKGGRVSVPADIPMDRWDGYGDILARGPEPMDGARRRSLESTGPGKGCAVLGSSVVWPWIVLSLFLKRRRVC